MKKSLMFLLLAVSIQVNAQVNFNSYTRVTDVEFKNFLALFERRDLPFGTDDVIAANIWSLNNRLSEGYVNKYLKDEEGVIGGPLYYLVPADDTTEVAIEGDFYPLYKLPTNGNYVLLVFAQLDKTKECSGRVYAMSYDLSGNFLYFVNLTYGPATEYINGFIDGTLKSHHVYLIRRVNGDVVFPPLNEEFNAVEVHMTYQIHPDGKETEISMEERTGTYRFNSAECRFERIN